MKMDSSTQVGGQARRNQEPAARALAGGISERAALTIAALVTTGVVGAVATGLNALFVSLGYGA